MHKVLIKNNQLNEKIKNTIVVCIIATMISYAL